MRLMARLTVPILVATSWLPAPVAAEGELTTQDLGALKLREIGPALMGGRIADIAVDPRDSSTWYLAVGSGNVWKTENAGITWKPIFDDQPVYSTGAITLDPSGPDIVWLGTGENVSGRHVAWGDGVYKSLDGGGSWQNMGLADSRHISEILVDPRDGDVVFVAAKGSLWSAGGERGLYKTVDGGETWERVLHIDDDTGVTSIAFDPRDPDTVYAASYQRRRHIWSLLSGPGSGIHKSTDGGATWREITNGLPKGDMGKIGLAVSPANPDVVYATIEADEKERGFYRSLDRGESWEKRNSYISNGTGPHYYQEIVASPHDVDRVYQMDVFVHMTDDGGANFDYLGNGRAKHSDNHAFWIDPENPDHLLAGTDASLYESFDNGTTWRQFPNLPISQFYKVAVSDDEPFYNILGGAQDLGTLHGPSRTGNTEGVRNQDWYVPLGADGYAVDFEPGNPNIMYMETQVGNLQRVDRLSGEVLNIQPVAAPGDPPERFNWDAPLVISPHDPTRLYFGSQRLWRSNDRGNSWTAVSGDLTTDQNRYELPMFGGRVWSVDDLYDNGAMSWYATLTTVDESPVTEGVIYTGSDDGIISVSEDAGATWWQAATPAGVPALSFVNDIRAGLHDADTVFAAFDAHKTGDLAPYLFVSGDRGRTWSSITGDLPDETIVWAIQQDHVDPDLLFIGTEFGMYTSLNRGTNWVRLGGAPTISFRDLIIQRRENDVVGATFGRGFYVLDDYSALRDIAAGVLDAEANLFPVRDTWWFVPSEPGQARGVPSLGSDHYKAPNPPFGAIITYHLAEAPKTEQEARHEVEKEQREAGEDTPFPGWETLAAEDLEQDPRVLLSIRDASGNLVRRMSKPAKEGVQRAAWDLRFAPPDPVDFYEPAFRPPWWGDSTGPLATPGTYSVEMSLVSGGEITSLGESQSFEVVAAPGFSLGEPDYASYAAFTAETHEFLRRGRSAGAALSDARDRLRYMRQAVIDASDADPALLAQIDELEVSLTALRVRLQGDRTRGRWDEPSVPSIMRRGGSAAWGHWDTRQAPTETQKSNLAIAQQDFETFRVDLKQILEVTIPELEAVLEAAGAPWTPGRKLPD